MSRNECRSGEWLATALAGRIVLLLWSATSARSRPVGSAASLGHVARVARAGASSGLAALRSRDAGGSADKAAKMLAKLRGVATKLGQMVGGQDAPIASASIGQVHRAPVLRARPGKHTKQMNAYVRLALTPLCESPYRVTLELAASVVDRFKSMAMALRKLGRDELDHLPPGLLFLTRLQFGFYSVLARLDVDADYAAVEANFLDDTWAAIQ